MDVKRNIMKDRNSESPDSTLKVNYVVDFGKGITDRRIKLNPILFKNNKIINPKIKFRISELRKEQFNSYSNENMDFFRLDHVSERDRNNYHNIFMDKLKPINRSENFQKFNQIRNNIQYIDYLKENRLLNQNKKIIRNIISDKEKETNKIRKKYFTLETEKNILPEINNNYNGNNNDYYMNHNLNNENNDYDKNYYENKIIRPYQLKRNDSYVQRIVPSLSDRYIKIPKKVSNSYISNINDYNIKEGDINLYPEVKNLKLFPTVQKNYTNNEQIRRLYNIEKSMNYREAPFYKAYKEINKNGGFNKRSEDISRYDNISQNKIYYRNQRNNLGKNEYRDMKNMNSHNFHKHNFTSNNY